MMFVLPSLSLQEWPEGWQLQRLRADVGYGKSRVECGKVGMLDHGSDVRILHFIFQVRLLHNEHWQPFADRHYSFHD